MVLQAGWGAARLMVRASISTRLAEIRDGNPLAAGFYTVAEAARLIEVGRARRILGWLRGYPGREAGPLLIRDFEPLDGRQELSFLDLIEVRFVEHFREQGVGVRTLRRALENARQVFGSEKPFATRRIRFRVVEDKRNIFVEEVLRPTAEETGDRVLWSLLTKQYEIYELIHDKLVHGVDFDPLSELAVRWRPRIDVFPDILLDPMIAYGQPVCPSRIPTRTLFEAWEAEGGDAGLVADWHDVPVHEVQQAVAFEQALAKPTRAALQ